MGFRIEKALQEMGVAWHEAAVINYYQWKEDKKRVLHAYTNFWVEWTRATPYLTGHLQAWTFPLVVIALLIWKYG